MKFNQSAITFWIIATSITFGVTGDVQKASIALGIATSLSFISDIAGSR